MRSHVLPATALVVALSITGLSVGQFGPLAEHPAGACSLPFHVQGAGWDFCWQQDDGRAQGVELNQVYFHGESVIWKMGFPFSLTRYEEDAFGPFKDTLGQSFPFGNNPGFGRGSLQIHPLDCPRFLGDGLLLNDRRVCVETRDGPEPSVALWARYDIFNYKFLQGYILDSRGVIEPFVRLGGLLIDGDSEGGANATNHFHHMYWRVDMDIGQQGDDGFQVFLRPHPDWNDWDPATPGQENGTQGSGSDSRCMRLQEAPNRGPPGCGDSGYGNQTVLDPLAGFPPSCRQQVHDGITGWCPVVNETPLSHHPALFTKWRVEDFMDTNELGRGKSFESTGLTHVGIPDDGEFTSFDVLALHYQGDSAEIGFEVPPVPVDGDSYLGAYYDPPEAIQDPVVWFSVNAYHDTRDEEMPTMVYHHISFEIEPRSFLSQNPGEDTFDSRQLPNLDPPIEI